jgi:hypothetical protein
VGRVDQTQTGDVLIAVAINAEGGAPLGRAEVQDKLKPRIHARSRTGTELKHPTVQISGACKLEACFLKTGVGNRA